MLKRRITLTLLGLTALAVPFWAQAADFRAPDRGYTLSRSETISRDLYVASGTVSIRGRVDGDLFVAGGTVRVGGEVTGDVFAAGGTVTIDGKVGESVRVAGGTVTIDGSVGRNVAAAGGTISLTERSTVAGEVDVAGGSVTLAGSSRAVQIVSEDILIEESAKIDGSLQYTSDTEARIETGAAISGETTRHPIEKRERADVESLMWGGAAFFWLSTLLVALLFLWLLPVKAAGVASLWRTRFPMSLLYGFVALIAIPILAVLFFITVLGIPLGLITLFGYFVLLYLAGVTGIIAVGDWLVRLVDKEAAPRVSWIAPVVGAVIFFAVGLIPILGGLALFALFLAALGALLRFDADFYRAGRKAKRI